MKFAALWLLLILLIPSSLAFTASSDYETISVCACNSVTDVITVTNDNRVQRISLSQSKRGSEFSYLYDDSELFFPGEQMFFTNRVTAPCVEGDYTLKTTFKGEVETKSFSQVIKVMNCGDSVGTDSGVPPWFWTVLYTNIFIGLILVLVLLLFVASGPKKGSLPSWVKVLFVILLIILAVVFMVMSYNWYTGETGHNETNTSFDNWRGALQLNQEGNESWVWPWTREEPERNENNESWPWENEEDEAWQQEESENSDFENSDLPWMNEENTSEGNLQNPIGKLFWWIIGGALLGLLILIGIVHIILEWSDRQNSKEQ